MSYFFRCSADGTKHSFFHVNNSSFFFIFVSKIPGLHSHEYWCVCGYFFYLKIAASVFTSSHSIKKLNSYWCKIFTALCLLDNPTLSPWTGCDTVSFWVEQSCFEFRVFPSLRIVALLRLKNPVFPTIYTVRRRIDSYHSQ